MPDLSNSDFARQVAVMSHLAGVAEMIDANALAWAAADRRDGAEAPEERVRLEWIRRAAYHLGCLAEAVETYVVLGAARRQAPPVPPGVADYTQPLTEFERRAGVEEPGARILPLRREFTGVLGGESGGEAG